MLETAQPARRRQNKLNILHASLQHFQIIELPVPGEYVIVTSAEQIDREITERFDLTVNCRDHGENVMSTSLLIVVNVEDINDHRPVFSKSEYTAEIRENTQLSGEVCFVNS
jgi:hypothetical protein